MEDKLNKHIIKNNLFELIKRTDVQAVIVWSVLFLIFIFISFQKWGSPIIDCGRDPYIASQLITGVSLYTDLYYIYGPFVPFFLAFLFLVFGINLSTAYACGIVFSYITLILFYSIARFFFKAKISCILTCMVIFQFYFNPTIFNYIFPYTYSALFGVFFCYICLICILLHLKTGKSLFFNISFLAAGFALITKLEFGVAIVFALIFYLFLRKKDTGKINLKSVIINILIITIIPFISYSVVIYKAGLNNFIDYINYNSLSLSSAPQKFYIETSFGLNLLKYHFDILMNNMFILLFIVFLTLFIVYLYFKTGKKIFSSVYVPIIAIFCCLLVILKLVFPDVELKRLYDLKDVLFNFFPTICFITSIVYLVKKIFFKQSLSLQQTSIMIIAIYLTSLMLRNFLNVQVNEYGVFTLPLTFIVLLFIAMDLAKKYESFIKKDYLVSLLVVFFLFTTMLNYHSTYALKNVPVSTDRGTILMPKDTAKTINILVQYILKNTKKEETIVLFPEENLLYFLTDRKSVSKFTDFLPMRLVNEQQEKEFIQVIKKESPLIAITNRPSSEYIYAYWGKDYNTKIFQWIEQNYSLCKNIGKFSYNNYLRTYGVKVFRQSCK